MKLTAKRVILFGLEETYGTDPTLDGTNAIACMNLNLAPYAGSMENRDRAHPNFDADPETPNGLNRTLSFDLELAGSGAAGTPPLYGPILRACGLAETVTEETKVEYAPVSTGWESGFGYFNWDALLHKTGGARGTLTLRFQGGASPVANVSLTGLVATAETDTAFAADVEDALADFLQALEVNKANTTFSLHGYSAELDSLELVLGNVVVFRDRPNAAYVALTNRRVTGTVVIAAPTLATKNYFTALKGKTLGALSLVHGTVAGNIIQLDADKVQVGLPSYADLNGVQGLSLPLTFTRTEGDDAFKLTVK